ncbi:MAG: hypothetical protein ACFFFT_12455 [Candidatus Thorarchaeota archaeon]
MKKLAEKLKKVDIKLPKWTRNLLYEHLMEVCEDLKNLAKYKDNLSVTK